MTRRRTLWLAVALVAGLVPVALGRTARGDAVSDQAMRVALARGRALFQQAWVQGGKACATCHASGRNRLTAARLKTYPKYDAGWRRVITAQQKINHMIKSKAGGAPLQLGSDDLNALEAWISRIR